MDWKLYYEDDAIGWFLYVEELNDTFVEEGQEKIVDIEEFYADAAQGNLPAYSFLNPRWYADEDKWNSTHSYGMPND